MTSERDQAAPRLQPDPGSVDPRGRDDRRRNVVVGVLGALLVLALVVGGAVWSGRDSTTAAPAAAECGDGVDPVADPVQLDAAPEPVQGTWTVTLETTCGPITMELDGDAAPVGVGSFVGLVEAGYYDATPCHRLTTSGIFVLQCGDPTGTGTGGPGYSYGPVENAPADDVYPAGTVAMARVGGDGESMGSQFFLVHEDSTIPSDAAGGYTVLGRITAGLDVVRTVAEGGLAEDGVAPARSTGIVSVTAEEQA